MKKIDWQDLKEKTIVACVMTGVFLPVRLLFYQYVSQYWVGSFGLVSLMAIVMFVLVRKKKLGKFGIIYEKQMSKGAHGKLGKVFITSVIMSILVFSIALVFMDRYTSYWGSDTHEFLAILCLGNNGFCGYLEKIHVTAPTVQELLHVQQIPKADAIKFLKQHEINTDFMGSLILGIMNQVYRGWVAHFAVVGLVTACEMLGLFFFYQRVFKKEPLETDH